MAAKPSIDPARFLHDQLAAASPDLLRLLLSTFIDVLMSAEADALCGASYGMSSPDRVNVRNGCRHRDFDTRAGTVDVAIPKLRSGSYFPDWLLERRRRAEAAPVLGSGNLLPAGRVHPSDGEAGREPGHHQIFPLAGVGDGPRARRARRILPHPATGPGSVHVRGGRRLGAQGPRGYRSAPPRTAPAG